MAPKTLEAKKAQLYSKCAAKDSGTVFSQDDLVNFKVSKDLDDLVIICQELVNSRLFQIVTLGDGQVCYRIRNEKDAKKLTNLNDKENLVYSLIESFSTSGIWTKTLKAKTNLHQTIITRCLKTLESLRYIKQIKSVRFPGRKIYMLYDLSPNEETTGGPWYNDGELDTEFIDQLSPLIEMHVRKASWREESWHAPPMPSSKNTQQQQHPTPLTGSNTDKPTKHNPKHITAKPHPVAAYLLSPPTDPTFFGPALESLRHTHAKQLLPLQPGSQDYPSTSDILSWLDSKGIIQNKKLDLPNLQQLLDVLEFDGKIERVGERRRARKKGDSAADAEWVESDEEDEDDDVGDEVDEDEDLDAAAGEDEVASDDDGEDDEAVRNPGLKRKRSTKSPTTEPALPAKKRKGDDREYTTEPTYRWTRRPEVTWAQFDLPSVSASTPLQASNQRRKDSVKDSAEAEPSAEPDRAKGKAKAADGDAEQVDTKEAPKIDYPLGPGNGFAEAPCSRCPAFELCEGEGEGDGLSGMARPKPPVDAGVCRYFGAWLEV